MSSYTQTGQTFVQLDPLDFLERISAFVPHPRSHRRHYHGIFAPNSPLRKNVVANAKNRPEAFSSRDLHEAADKVKKVSLNWAKLIARIYDVNPLICVSCGNKITIVAFVTHAEEIRRILKGTIWPVDPP
ncbi:MAG: transposase, partial [Chlamydiales bacterium]